MNAPSPKLNTIFADDYASMNGQADKWRGECMQEFGRLEKTVEDLLVLLSQGSRHSKEVKPGQPIGAAFNHLRDLTGSKGPFADQGRKISVTLAELALWFEWRAHLSHGDLTVWQGKKKQWLLAFAHRPKKNEPIRTFAITWADARALRGTLAKATEELSKNAASLVNAVKQKS